jgi:hypothetical protein
MYDGSMVARSTSRLPGAAVAAALGMAGCLAPPPPAVPEMVPIERFDASTPQGSSSWLCLPGRDDACTRDLTATEVHPDGTLTIERFTPAAAPKADCFYVYPTVDLSPIPGNHRDFTNIEPMASVALAQAARFRQSCALYAPLYRQVTIGTYLQGGERVRRGLAVAFSDVEAAFAEYLALYNRGRPVVLLGHSQGADMTARLVRRFFDHDDALRARLLLAMPIGGNIEAPRGQTVGGTFDNVPQCTSSTQTACVLSYRTYAAGAAASAGPAAPKPGNASVCVNPADVENNSLHVLSAAYYPVNDRSRSHIRGIDGVATPWVRFSQLYAGRCVEGQDGFRFLEVSRAVTKGDVRPDPVDFHSVPASKVLGLHILDFQLLQGDLLDQVARRVALLP